MKLSSPAFQNNTSIPAKYTCQGENINPPLQIDNIPAGTKSLVLIVDDPDAPSGKWIHWILFNISPDTKNIDEKSVPDGAVEGETDFGTIGYGGPCPPSGTHHYFFILFAINNKLSFVDIPTEETLLKQIENHILAKAELIGLYRKK